MKHCFVKSLVIILLFLIVILGAQDLIAQNEYTYYSKGKRDPFIPLVTSEVRTSLGLRVVETIEDIKLEGVIFDPFGKSMAVLNGEVVKEGDKIYNVEIVKIYNDAISIKIYDQPHTVNLVKERGETFE